MNIYEEFALGDVVLARNEPAIVIGVYCGEDGEVVLNTRGLGRRGNAFVKAEFCYSTTRSNVRARALGGVMLHIDELLRDAQALPRRAVIFLKIARAVIEIGGGEYEV